MLCSCWLYSHLHHSVPVYCTRSSTILCSCWLYSHLQYSVPVDCTVIYNTLYLLTVQSSTILWPVDCKAIYNTLYLLTVQSSTILSTCLLYSHLQDSISVDCALANSVPVDCTLYSQLQCSVPDDLYTVYSHLQYSVPVDCALVDSGADICIAVDEHLLQAVRWNRKQ